MSFRSRFRGITCNQKQVAKALLRKKHVNVDEVTPSQLNRCLSTMDLTFLGIGSTLGLGVYVISGQVAANSSGPAVIISFLIAAVASVFAGLCYAEFGARVPRAGSAYVYSYVTVGEFIAFIIGWNLILEYVIGTASVARGYSGYIDFLCNGTMATHLKSWMPIHIEHMSEYPDFLALAITIGLTGVLAIGVSESTKFNNVFTCLNLLIVLYVVICGLFKADIHNWQLRQDEIPSKKFGSGGFFPYGISKMMTGASTCFYAFVGFDCVATSGEEVRNPQRAIPISIISSLFVVFLAYFGVSAVQTLMWPYYDLAQSAPLPFVFDRVGWHSAKWVISLGALAGLSTSLLGAMFPLPRVLYAMASDGIIFRWIAKVHPRFKTPLIATFISGIFSGIMAMLFNVDDLAKMMSIGTLQAYSLVAISVLFLRYQLKMETVPMHPPAPVSPTNLSTYSTSTNDDMGASVQLSNSIMISRQDITYKDLWRQLYIINRESGPTQVSSKLCTILILLIICIAILLDGLLVLLENYLTEVGTIIGISLVGVLLIAACFALWCQPQSPCNISFKTPLMPFTPIMSVVSNVYLMFKLEPVTWIRFAVWLGIGFIIYFGYGIWNSNERKFGQRSEQGGAAAFVEPEPEHDIIKNETDTETAPLIPSKH